MDYFSILELDREPFSNSPDPDFFFQSGQHQGCLQRLELALRLKRGLNVVIGDVGTGKTTLCRQLIRKFADDPDMETHLILDPDFSSPLDLLQTVASLFDGRETKSETDPWQLKERIKHALFQKGVDQGKTVALIVDEGQKIPEACLEPLLEFLNYETNEHKLLQIAVFAQPEFEKTLAARPNFADRINLKHTLGPMSFRDTRQMIRYRLRQSSEAGHREDLFTLSGLWAVYRTTGGYPRKIVHLCHQCLLAVIIQNRRRAGWSLVRSCGRRSSKSSRLFGLRPGLAAFLSLIVLGGIAVLPPIQALWLPEETETAQVQRTAPQETGTAESPPAGDAAPTTPQKNTPSAVPRDSAPPAPLKGATRTASTSPDATPAGDIAPGSTAAPGTTGRTDFSRNSSPSEMPPEFLGTVVLQNRETLWRLVKKVYGRFDPSYLESIREANPRIGNPKKVVVGSAVRVPAIPAKVGSSEGDIWWIRIGEKASLEDAVDALRRHPETLPPIRIVPHWDPKEGLSFSVLLKGRFLDKDAARYEMERLKKASGVDAELFSGWKPDTVFYADPYQGG